MHADSNDPGINRSIGEAADVVLVVGSTGEVYPAASLPRLAADAMNRIGGFLDCGGR